MKSIELFVKISPRSFFFIPVVYPPFAFSACFTLFSEPSASQHRIGRGGITPKSPFCCCLFGTLSGLCSLPPLSLSLFHPIVRHCSFTTHTKDEIVLLLFPPVGEGEVCFISLALLAMSQGCSTLCHWVRHIGLSFFLPSSVLFLLPFCFVLATFYLPWCFSVCNHSTVLPISRIFLSFFFFRLFLPVPFPSVVSLMR